MVSVTYASSDVALFSRFQPSKEPTLASKLQRASGVGCQKIQTGGGRWRYTPGQNVLMVEVDGIAQNSDDPEIRRPEQVAQCQGV